MKTQELVMADIPYIIHSHSSPKPIVTSLFVTIIVKALSVSHYRTKINCFVYQAIICFLMPEKLALMKHLQEIQNHFLHDMLPSEFEG